MTNDRQERVEQCAGGNEPWWRCNLPAGHPGPCRSQGWLDAQVAPAKMTAREFSVMNRERCEAPNGFNHKLDSWSTSDWFTAILGELGEAANVAKKINRVRDGIRGNKETEQQLRDKLRQELGDTFVYLDLLAQSLGFYINDAALEVFDSKSKELGYHAAMSPAPRCTLCGKSDKYIRHPGTCSHPFHDDFLRHNATSAAPSVAEPPKEK